MGELRIAAAEPQSPPALALLAQAVAEARQPDPELFSSAAPAPTNPPRSPRALLLLAWLDGLPAGCAGLYPLEGDCGELRRMFTTRAARRRGVARRLLAALEQAGRAFGDTALRLETGDRQPEALALCRACGYVPSARYGRRCGDPSSRCFQQRLRNGH